MTNMQILEIVKDILDKKFEYVSINFLEDELFNNVILNGISIEPAGENYKSIGLGGFAENEIESISFNIHLIKKEEFEGDKSLENFINDKDEIVKAIYSQKLLGIDGFFRNIKIETEPLKFTDDEVQFAVWIYKIKVYGEVR